MLGLLALDPERVTRFVTAILSCLGGYLAGFVLAGVCAYFLDRWLTRGRSPKGMHSAARHIGGIAGRGADRAHGLRGIRGRRGCGWHRDDWHHRGRAMAAPEADPRRRRPRSRKPPPSVAPAR